MRRFILLSAVGTWLLAAAGCAPVKVLPKQQRSVHFAAAARHLDLGGTMFLYADISGDMQALTKLVSEVVAEVAKQEPESKLGGIDVAALMGHLGLGQVQAVGLSSYRDGKIFHNKGIVYQTAAKKGLMLLMGDHARPFETPLWAPADADLVFEQDYKAEKLFEMIAAIMHEAMGDEADEVLAELDRPIPGMRTSPRQIIDQLDTRIVGVVRMHSDHMLQVPGEDFSFPYTEFLLGVDKLGFLFDDLVESFGANPLVKAESGERFETLRPKQTLPGPFSVYAPVLAKDKKSGRVYLASSPALLDEIAAAAKPLGRAPDFIEATRGLPKLGNGLTYIGAGFVGEIIGWLRTLAARDAEVAFMVDMLEAMLPATDVPMASCTAAIDEGLFFASNATSSHKATLLALAYANPMMLGMLAAVAVPAFIARAAERPPIVEPRPAQAAPAPPAPPAPPQAATKPAGQK